MADVPAGGFRLNNSFSALEALSKIKQREVPCPIIKQRALTTSLMTIDDMTLKTTIAAPDLYDVELTKLVHRHTNFPEINEQLSVNTFMENLSYIDRKCLIWGIFASTYGTLGKIDITCPYCEYTFNDEVKAEDLIQPDSITPWDKDVPFKEYICKLEHICNIEGLYKIEFDISLPTIAQHLAIMHLIPADKLRENFNRFGNVFSRTEDVSSIIRALRVFKIEDDINPETYVTPKDIHKVVTLFLTMDISDAVLNKYNEEFSKYTPVFKKPYTCSECGNNFDYVADPEASLFRQFFRRG